jgi:hypothetical protein
MFSFTELRGQSSLDKHGSIELHTEFFRIRRPIWLVFLKVLGVVAMVAVGFAIALPTMKQEFPKLQLWQSSAAIAAAMMAYTAIAFFIRPEANGDNMGWFGGSANDPTQYSDNVNRFLWKAHMVLGPGRFTAETLLDMCVLVGLIKGVDPDYDENMPEYTGATPEAILASTANTPPGSGPATGLYSAPPPASSGMQLDSWKYFQQQS